MKKWEDGEIAAKELFITYSSFEGIPKSPTTALKNSFWPTLPYPGIDFIRGFIITWDNLYWQAQINWLWKQPIDTNRFVVLQ